MFMLSSAKLLAGNAGRILTLYPKGCFFSNGNIPKLEGLSSLSVFEKKLSRQTSVRCWASGSSSPSQHEPQKFQKKNPPQQQNLQPRLTRVTVREGKASQRDAYCIGCGVLITSKSDPVTESKGGVITTKTREDLNLNFKKQVKISKHSEKVKRVCKRCADLRRGDLKKAWEKSVDVQAEVFRNQLTKLSSMQVLVMMVVDAADFEGSFYGQLRNLVGKNPIILVVTKCDLLPGYPESLNHALWYFTRRAQKGKKLNVKHTVLVSGATGEGMESLATMLKEEVNGRNVYVVGCANSGKSTLCQALVAELTESIHYNGSRGYKRKRELQDLEVTCSALPGTTLQSIRIPCFKSHRHALYDTPGLIAAHRLAHTIFPAVCVPQLLEPQPLVGQSYLVPEGHSLIIRLARQTGEAAQGSTESNSEEEEGSGLASDALARIDVTMAPVAMVLYGPMGALEGTLVRTEDAPLTCRIPPMPIEQVRRVSEYKGVPREEMKAKMLSLFEAADSDGDGKLSPGQFRACVGQKELNLSNVHKDTLVAEFGSSGCNVAYKEEDFLSQCFDILAGAKGEVRPLVSQQEFKPKSFEMPLERFTGDVAFSGLCWVGMGSLRPFQVKAWVMKGSESWARECMMERDVWGAAKQLCPPHMRISSPRGERETERRSSRFNIVRRSEAQATRSRESDDRELQGKGYKGKVLGQGEMGNGGIEALSQDEDKEAEEEDEEISDWPESREALAELYQQGARRETRFQEMEMMEETDPFDEEAISFVNDLIFGKELESEAASRRFFGDDVGTMQDSRNGRRRNSSEKSSDSTSTRRKNSRPRKEDKMKGSTTKNIKSKSSYDRMASGSEQGNSFPADSTLREEMAQWRERRSGKRSTSENLD